MEPKATVGRIVHYHFVNARGTLVTRPAVIVQTWGGDGDGVNLQVFTDGSNDAPNTSGAAEWRTTVLHSTEVQENRWSWPPRA